MDAPIACGTCVIGSGPAGAIVALELAAAGEDVLLVEAGGNDPGAAAMATLDRLDLAGNADLQFGRAFQVGGSSNLWAGRVAPFEAIDFEHREWMADSRWPFPRDALASGYARAFALMGLEEPAIGPPEKPAALRSAIASDGLEIKSFAWSRPPFNIGETVKAKADKPGGPRLLTNAPVVALHETENGEAIAAAEVALPDGTRRRIEAQRYVLAAGGLEVPRLLLASTGVRPSGIGNDHDLVGRYFSTHPKADMAALVLNRGVGLRHPLFTDQPVGSTALARAGIGFTAGFQREHRLPNHYVQLSPLLEFQASKAFEKARGSSAITSPLIEKNRVMKRLLPSLGLLAFEAIGKLAGLQLRARTFILRGFLDQIPDPSHRVTLSDKRDANGVPLIDLAWRLTEDDRASILRFFELLDGVVRARGIGHVEFGGLRKEGEWPITAIHSHFMGTTRMAEDPRQGVVDADCRVHGSANLYIAGPSVFPTYGYSNPYLTIGAVSYRLSDHLLGRG